MESSPKYADFTLLGEETPKTQQKSGSKGCNMGTGKLAMIEIDPQATHYLSCAQLLPMGVHCFLEVPSWDRLMVFAQEWTAISADSLHFNANKMASMIGDQHTKSYKGLLP